MHTINFGTDGWRAIIARDFTFENVRYVAWGIAEYLEEVGLSKKPVVVGYDARFLADEFAAEASGVLAAQGLSVLLTNRDSPTPAVTWAVREYDAAGAVILTASHNPPAYCGIKFIPWYCHPALPDVTQRIEAHTAEAQAKSGIDCDRGSPRIELFDPKPAYFEQLRRVIDCAAIADAKPHVWVDTMYGVGRGYLDEFIRCLGCAVTLIHGERNPLFGGRLPDPVEENLTELSQGVVGSKAVLGLALDGDADRFGIVDATGLYVNPNQVITITYYHLITTRGKKGPAIRTTATTRQVDALAKLVGEDCYEVPVGFKFVGQKLSETNAVVGGEESGGLSIRGHIPEKDGPLADLLILEHYCSSSQTPMETLAEINQKTGEFHTTRLDLHIQPGAKERLMRSLQNSPPGKFASQPATAKMIDGVTLTLADGSWCMIRPSGTEPVVRFYLESNDAAVLREMEIEARALVEEAEREI